MSRIIMLTMMAVFGLFITSCEKTPLTAEGVAHEFWQAVQAGKSAKVKKWVVPVSGQEIQQGDFPKLKAYQFDKMVIEQTQAVFNTSLETADKDQPLLVRTYLQKTDDTWQVDYQKTLASYQRHSQVGELFDQLSDLGELLNDEINQSLDKLNETLPQLEQEIDEIEKKVESELPQLQEKVQSFLEKLMELFQRWTQSESGEEQSTET